MRISQTKDGIVLEVLVKPRSGVFKIIVEGDDVIVHCTEEPVKGKVNRELVNELTKIFHKEVAMVSGVASKQKLLLIKGASEGEVEKVLVGAQSKFIF
jgi:uncharacterized protein (TIGR00251 family)